jgi:hypothetical protein
LARVDLAARAVDLAGEVGDEGERAVESSARSLARLERLEKADAADPEHVAVGGGDPVLGEDRRDAVL